MSEIYPTIGIHGVWTWKLPRWHVLDHWKGMGITLGVVVERRMPHSLCYASWWGMNASGIGQMFLHQRVYWVWLCRITGKDSPLWIDRPNLGWPLSEKRLVWHSAYNWDERTSFVANWRTFKDKFLNCEWIPWLILIVMLLFKLLFMKNVYVHELLTMSWIHLWYII